MNPKNSLIADAFAMHQMEGYALLEEYRIRAEEEKALEEEKSQPENHEVNITFDEVNKYPSEQCVIINDRKFTTEALAIIKSLSVEEMVALMGMNHLSTEDAGGQYLLTVKNNFYHNASMMIKEFQDVDYYGNPEYCFHKDNKNINLDLFKMDEADVLDILMSLYGEQEAETTIHPHRNIMTFTEKVMDLTWNHVANTVNAKFR